MNPLFGNVVSSRIGAASTSPTGTSARRTSSPGPLAARGGRKICAIVKNCASRKSKQVPIHRRLEAEMTADYCHFDEESDGEINLNNRNQRSVAGFVALASPKSRASQRAMLDDLKIESKKWRERIES
jgi:hypothetical protein